MLHSSHLRNTRNEKYPSERMSERSGQERTESGDVTFYDFTTLSVVCTSYFLSPVKGSNLL